MNIPSLLLAVLFLVACSAPGGEPAEERTGLIERSGNAGTYWEIHLPDQR